MHLPGKVVAGIAAVLGAAACAFLLFVVVGQGVAQASLWAGVLAAVAAIAGTVWAIWPATARQPANLTPRVVITSPTGRQPVQRATTVRGLAEHIPGDMTLWLVVRAPDGYYPQRKIRLPVAGTGNWTEPVYFGTATGSVGHEFTLYVVGAAPLSSSRLELYRQQVAEGRTSPLSQDQGTYPDVEQYASIDVIRGP